MDYFLVFPHACQGLDSTTFFKPSNVGHWFEDDMASDCSLFKNMCGPLLTPNLSAWVAAFRMGFLGLKTWAGAPTLFAR
jgi:hypothetical protein